MRRNYAYVLLGVFMLFLASCKSKKTLPIPQDAMVVVEVNTAGLKSKLTWEEIRKSAWFADAQKESTDSTARKLLNDPATSGVDTDQDMAFYMLRKGQNNLGVVTGFVKDAEAFGRFSGKDKKVTKDGDLSLIAQEEGLVAWNGSQFLYLMKMPSTPSPLSENSEEAKPVTPDSLRLWARTLLTLEEKNQLQSDKRFAALRSEEGDMRLWMNSGLMYSDLAGGALSMMKASSLVEGNVSASSLSFVDGKISMKMKQYYGEQMQKMLDKHKPQPVSDDLLGRIPSNDIAAAMVMNYPADGLYEIFKMAGVEGIANSMLGNYNLSLQELCAAFKGQMLISLSDFKVAKKEIDMPDGSKFSTTAPDMKMLFAASVNNKATFEKLIGLAEKSMPAQNPASVSLQVNNEWFAVGNAKEHVGQFLAGGKRSVPFADKVKGHPFGLYIDLQKLMTGAEGFQAGGSVNDMLQTSKKMWQNVVMTGGEYSNGMTSFTAEINMVDGKTNSLKQLNKYLETMYKARPKPEMQSTLSDSTALITEEAPAP